MSPRLIEPAPCDPLPDPLGAVDRALNAPLGSKPLRELASGKKSAVIVISDATRPVPNGLLLPPLLAELEAGGIPAQNVALLVATGLHEPPDEPGIMALCGREIPEGVRLLAHDSRNPDGLTQVAEVEGVAVKLNAAYLDAELKILTGMIEPHALAGFSGGAKSLVPGLCGLDTLKLVHSFALVERIGDSTGRVAGNPLRELIGSIAKIAGVDFVLNVLFDRNRALTGLFAGALDPAFGAGCEAASHEQLVPVDRLADAVLSTGGGEPLDRTLYQGCKGLITGAKFLKPGGTLAFVARCADGLGSEGFCETVRTSGSPEGFAKIYSDPQRFTVDQWAVQALNRALTKAGRVVAFAPGLARGDAACLGITLMDTPEALMNALGENGGEVFILRDGPYVTAKSEAT